MDWQTIYLYSASVCRWESALLLKSPGGGDTSGTVGVLMVAKLVNLMPWHKGLRGILFGLDNCDLLLVLAAAVLCLAMLV